MDRGLQRRARAVRPGRGARFRAGAASLALLVALPGAALAGPTRVSDEDVRFHRVHVIGCAYSDEEEQAFERTAAELRDGVERHQANGSTSRTLRQPTKQEVADAIAAAKRAARAGDEITFAYTGHGGGQNGEYGQLDTGNEGNEDYDEHMVQDCGTEPDGTERTRLDREGGGRSISDDELAAMFLPMPAGVTLVVIMDTCWGGGFTGGADDLPETDDITVVGPEGECPSGTGMFDLSTFGGDVGEGTEDRAADTNSDGIVTGNELKTYLSGEGWELGPPVDAEPKKLKNGDSACATPDGRPCGLPAMEAPSVVVAGGQLPITGTGFAPNSVVGLRAETPGGTTTELGSTTTDADGAFALAVPIGLPEGRYLLAAADGDGGTDADPLSVHQLGGTFRDDDGSPHERWIEALAGAGVTRGCNPPADDLFCPGREVSRGQLAAFLVRGFGLPASREDRFIDDDGVFEADVQALAAAGVTAGCNPPANDRFCPDESVTRAQMATFLTRVLDLRDGAGEDLFIDDDGSPHEHNIDRLATRGITLGCNPPVNDRFCPHQTLVRAQMATLLGRSLLLLPVAVNAVAPVLVDIDGDGEAERIGGDTDRRPEVAPTVEDGDDADQDPDTVTLGTKGGGTFADPADTDGDGEDEVVVADPTRGAGQIHEKDLDGDGTTRRPDLDVLYVGTGGGGRVCPPLDLDGDGDEEVVVTDPTLPAGRLERVDVDSDGDVDVVWVGTQGGGDCAEAEDTDGDGEPEVVVTDPTRERGSTTTGNVDGGSDSDADVVWRGTAAPSSPPPDDGPPPEETPG